jgi:hypothetical protein
MWRAEESPGHEVGQDEQAPRPESRRHYAHHPGRNVMGWQGAGAKRRSSRRASAQATFAASRRLSISAVRIRNALAVRDRDGDVTQPRDHEGLPWSRCPGGGPALPPRRPQGNTILKSSWLRISEAICPIRALLLGSAAPRTKGARDCCGFVPTGLRRGFEAEYHDSPIIRPCRGSSDS